MDDNKDKQEDLEVMFQKLELLIMELEGDQTSLENSFRLYNEGMNMIKKSTETIDMIEKKVQLIDQNGVIHEL